MIDTALPRLDLHRHLDGNVRLQTILDLARQHRVALPGETLETLRPHVVVQSERLGLMPFLSRLDWMTAAIADEAAVRRVARENVEDAASDGLDYVELRFSPYFQARPHGLDPVAVVRGVVAGIEEGRASTGIGVNLIGILSRTFGAEACTIELEALLTQRERIVALDLAGDEERFPAELFARHFARAREAGWAVTVHAGEAGPARNIWSALRVLGATRIGHGSHALEDPELMEYLALHRVGIEANITSNVQTGAASSYAAHPLRAFLDRGILASINTDNPIVSGIDWPHEIAVAAPAAGLTEAHIEQALRNAVEMAFLPESGKKALMQIRTSSGMPAVRRAYDS
jgi:adenosine deaminase